MTFCFSSISEEAIEDGEGPSETAADPEEVAKDQESGGEKDQSKWTGSVCGCPRAPEVSPLEDWGSKSESRRILNLPRKAMLALRVGEGFCFAFALLSGHLHSPSIVLY